DRLIRRGAVAECGLVGRQEVGFLRFGEARAGRTGQGQPDRRLWTEVRPLSPQTWVRARGVPRVRLAHHTKSSSAVYEDRPSGRSSSLGRMMPELPCAMLSPEARTLEISTSAMAAMAAGASLSRLCMNIRIGLLPPVGWISCCSVFGLASSTPNGTKFGY